MFSILTRTFPLANGKAWWFMVLNLSNWLSTMEENCLLSLKSLDFSSSEGSWYSKE